MNKPSTSMDALEPPKAAPTVPKQPSSPRKQFRMSHLSHHTLVYGVGILLGRAVAFVMLPIYTRVLTPADYGILQLIGMLLEVTAILAGSSIAGGVFHFYHKASTDEERNSVLSTALMLTTVAYFGVTGVATVAAPILADIVFGARGDNVFFIRLACMSLAFEGLVMVPLALIQLRHRSKLFVVVHAVKLFLQLVLNIVFLIPLRMGVTGVLLSTLIANVAIGIWLGVSFVRDVSWRVSVPMVTRLLRFGIPLVGTQICAFILTFGDRYFLNKAGGAAIVGLYGLAYQFGFLLVSIGYWPFNRAWQPVRFEIAKAPNRDEIYARAFVYLNILVVTMAVGLALFTKDLLRIVAAPAFHSAEALVPLILLASVLHVWTKFLNLGILIKERTEYYTLATWMSAVVAVGGYIWLIPKMLAWGAALATVLAYIVRHVAVYGFSQRLWYVRYRWGPVVRLLGLGVGVCMLEIAAPEMAIGMSVGMRLVLFAVFVTGMWKLDVLSEQDRALVLRAIRAPRSTLSVLIG